MIEGIANTMVISHFILPTLESHLSVIRLIQYGSISVGVDGSTSHRYLFPSDYVFIVCLAFKICKIFM